jgi:hypothetical protein
VIVTLIPHRHGQMFAAELPNGMRIKPMKVPIFGTARALLALGFAPDTLIEFRHLGSEIIAARGTVGELAKWTIEERDRSGLQKRRWRPFEDAHSQWCGGAKDGRAHVAGTEIGVEAGERLLGTTRSEEAA